jgi:hypothetical protein
VKRAIELCLLALVASSCTHSVHQIAMGGFDDVPMSARRRPIEVQADQDVFIASGNTDFADRALARLAAQCPRGRVVGIQARHSTSLGFLAYTNRMKMTGFCIEG